jgi:hypothetical protein
MSYEEEDTCADGVGAAEGCLSYEDEDTCMSYEEDTWGATEGCLSTLVQLDVEVLQPIATH